MKAVARFALSILTSLPALAFTQVPDHAWIQGEPPVQLTRQARLFVEAETQFNPLEKRSMKPFWIPHLEIPVQFVTEDKGLGLDPKILESMTFEADGVRYVRWVMNPEDSLFNEELRQKLVDLDIPFKQGKYYIGYLTSSRSCLIQDPNSQVIFSIKSSTNQTGGSWKDKKETPKAAKLGRMLSDYLQTTSHAERHSEFDIVKEPLAFSFADADQAIIVRQYDNLNDKHGKYLVPLFSIFHEQFGRDIAEDNGATDPEKFWFETLGRRTFARLVVRLAMNYGIAYNSPHGQNFLVELDSGRRPTGKLFIRDYADSHAYAPVMRAQGGQPILDLLKDFTKNLTWETKLALGFNPFYSGKTRLPSWIPSADPWKEAYQQGVKGHFSSMMMTPRNEVLNKITKVTRFDFDKWHQYWNVTIEQPMTTKGYKPWIRRLDAEHSARTGTSPAPSCPKLF